MHVLRVATLAAIVALAGCRFGPPRTEVVVVASPGADQPLPSIPVYEIASSPDTLRLALTPTRTRDPLAAITSTRRISLTSDNADARTLLLWLAQQAGVDLVVSSDVQSRVSVSFRDVLVVDAMRAILAEAGLSILVGELGAPWPPVVFHQLPVNIDVANAEAISARFGVSLELAKFIVESRPRP